LRSLNKVAITKTGARELVPVYRINGSFFGIHSKQRFHRGRKTVYKIKESLNLNFEEMSKEQLIGELHEKNQVITKLQYDLKRLELVFNYTQIGIVIGSADGKTLDYMNPAFAEMHDYTVEEMTGKKIEDVFKPAFRPKLPYITEMVHKKGTHNFECMHMRKDGTSFPVLVESIAVYSDDGIVLYRIVNVQDITEQKNEQKRNEEALIL